MYCQLLSPVYIYFITSIFSTAISKQPKWSHKVLSASVAVSHYTTAVVAPRAQFNDETVEPSFSEPTLIVEDKQGKLDVNVVLCC